MKIELNNVFPTYMEEFELKNSEVFNQPKVTFNKGEITLIKANSGKGKSSLLNQIYGLNHNFEGIINDGLQGTNPAEKRRSNFSYVFQDLKLFDELTAIENLVLKNRLTDHKTKEEILELINKMGLEHKTNSLVKSLSLGQKQRIAIIRAFCQPFDFLLMDEPFSHLDSESINRVVEITKAELKERNAGLIVTSLSDNNYFDYSHKLNV